MDIRLTKYSTKIGIIFFTLVHSYLDFLQRVEAFADHAFTASVGRHVTSFSDFDVGLGTLVVEVLFWRTSTMNEERKRGNEYKSMESLLSYRFETKGSRKCC